MQIQNRAPKHTERFKVVNAGRPTGGDAQGRGPPIVVRDGNADHMAKGQPTKVGQSVPLIQERRGGIVQFHKTEVCAMQDANVYLELVHERGKITLMNGTIRRYWKAACIERCTCSLGEGSQKSALAIGQLAGFLSYVETMFNIVRRMADYHFHQARSWEEMDHIHRKWVRDYNSQRHWAHESRDALHPPSGSPRIYPIPGLAAVWRTRTGAPTGHRMGL
jgi:hypothetical protein